MAQSKQSVRCSGTTLSGDKCRNVVSFDPKNPGPWNAKRCGRCSGGPGAADATAPGREFSLGGNGSTPAGGARRDTDQGTIDGVAAMLDEFVDNYDPSAAEHWFGCTMIEDLAEGMPDCLGCGLDQMDDFDGTPLEWANKWRERLQEALDRA